MTEYLVPYESAESEFEEKRSRFISHVFLAESEAEARARIDEMKKKYYDARHNCWCFVLPIVQKQLWLGRWQWRI